MGGFKFEFRGFCRDFMEVIVSVEGKKYVFVNKIRKKVEKVFLI